MPYHCFVCSVLALQLWRPPGLYAIDKWIEGNLLTNPQDSAVELRQVLVNQAFEAFRQGVQPAVLDAQLLTSNWGVKFEDENYYKAKIWYGTKDRNASVELVMYMAARLPHCTLREFLGGTHFLLQRYLEEVLLELISKERPGPKIRKNSPIFDVRPVETSELGIVPQAWWSERNVNL
ncbi:hypothetical protein N7468_004404 [Penicillium chermesinum]|uniref:Uncharacterized protein n=1 Tax=Penicillium chermesinum TaxID=63820 RepID=A0A9W9TSI7_9EURO|nr:uncharacterized protein N7468_004404 [Penicillium chermesinum]KAJ5239785.1 hypothetical protein N7468_004404 [Penicillium chermesinum]